MLPRVFLFLWTYSRHTLRKPRESKTPWLKLVYTSGMDKRITTLLDAAAREFDGESFNGPPLMATLDSLSAEEAASRNTYEAYSAWEIAVHCAYYKQLITRALLKQALDTGALAIADTNLDGLAPLEPFPYAEENFAPPPAQPTEEAWKTARAVLRRYHHALMTLLRAVDAESLDAEFTEWEVPFIDAVAWLATHDVYHNAQIRSMGLKSLRKPRES